MDEIRQSEPPAGFSLDETSAGIARHVHLVTMTARVTAVLQASGVARDCTQHAAGVFRVIDARTLNGLPTEAAR